jgi:RNA polymerase sigma-B factor
MQARLRQPADSEAELWRRLKQDGDTRAREALARRFLPLAHSLAARHRATGVTHEDMVQVANLGLVVAIDNFDPSRGVAFTTFAVPVIRGQLNRELERSGWAVRTPRQLQELMRRVRSSSEVLTARLGRTPTVAELATESGLSEEQVREAKRVELAMLSRTEYLGRRATARRRGDLEQNLDGRFDLISDASTIARAYASLTPRQRQALRLSFVEERAQHEIASEIGVSQRQVSRIIGQALDKLRRVAQAGAPSGEASRPS